MRFGSIAGWVAQLGCQVGWLGWIAALASAPAQARWATREDAASEIEFENVMVEVNRDGTSTQTVEVQKRVLKDSARSALAIERQRYNANTSEFKVLEARTINEDREYAVERKQIEDKPLASSPQGFDEQRQVLIAFPEVKVGSRVYLKYRRTTRDVPVKGFFADNFVYGWNEYEAAGTVKVISELPLQIEAHDPEGYLRTTHEVKEGKTWITVELKRPAYKVPVDETVAHMNPRSYPWVTVSSATKWEDLAKDFLPRYESVLSKPLPERFVKVLEAARARTGTVDRINAVTSGLAAQINYMGDWKSISGQYVPRELKTIAETQLGDCKDFSASTVAILRALGMKADVAFVNRGISYTKRPTSLPSLHDFNHAMVRVRAPEREYWVDPTNFASFAQGTFPDIAGRPALVLDAEKPVLARTTDLTPSDQEAAFALKVAILPDETRLLEGTLRLAGSASLPLTGASLMSSKESIDYNLVSGMGDRDRLLRWEVDSYDLTSRIVSDQEFRMRIYEKKSTLKTSAGPAYYLGTGGGYVTALMTNTLGRVSDLYLERPMTIRKELTLHGVKLVGDQSLSCSVKSKWATASREVKELAKAIRVRDVFMIHQSVVPNEELNSPAFASMQNKLDDCFYNAYLVYKKIPGAFPELKDRKLASPRQK